MFSRNFDHLSLIEGVKVSLTMLALTILYLPFDIVRLSAKLLVYLQ